MNQDRYWTEPRGDYNSRRRAFLEFSAGSESNGKRGDFFSQLCRLELNRGPLDEESVCEALAYVNGRGDCSDFIVSGLLRMLYQYKDSILLSQKLLEETRHTLLNFKYWLDEPGEDMMFYWTENHQIMFNADQYLAGQLFPEDIFPNSGKNGRWHLEMGRKRILGWIDLKARFGFSEWDSNCYYDEDFTPLLNLVDFSKDQEVVKRAAMILDVMFLDMAVDSFRGTYGTSHGRSYPGQVLSGFGEATSGVQKIAWGMGIFNSPNRMTAVCLATSLRYRVPKTIEALAKDMPEELINRERHSFDPEDAKRLGVGKDDQERIISLWGSGQFAHRKVVKETLRLANQFNSGCFNTIIRPYIEAVLGTYRELDERGISHDGDLDRRALSEVNKLTFRTPDYQLSCAQDYRKGKLGFQQHIWQATLGSDAVVFTVHRGNTDEVNYKHWVGRLPRAVQYRNLVIALYCIPEAPLPGPRVVGSLVARGMAIPSPGPSEEELLPYTVASFNRGVFDEVVERDGWILARKEKGYLALWSQRPVQWTGNGVFKCGGLIAKGRRNTWICQLGREDIEGSFQEWVQQISSASVEFQDLSVCYQAPGLGEVRFSWEDDLTVCGEKVPLCDYPRFDNPYCRAEYGSGKYEISFDEFNYFLDFKKGERQEYRVP